MGQTAFVHACDGSQRDDSVRDCGTDGQEVNLLVPFAIFLHAFNQLLFGRLNRQEAVGKKVFVIQNPKMNPLISAPVPMRDPPEQPIIRGSAPRPPSLRPGSNRGSVGARRPLTRPPPPPPLPRPPRLQPPQPQLVPEQPKPGLVQQMKEKLERRA